jgi:DNA primase
MEAFGLGWAPLAWSELADKFQAHGLLGFGEKAGLVVARQKGEGYYDSFRGRVIIPIRSPEGRTIAFGGRLLEGEDGPKYLNSRENRLYIKSEVLFGTDRARDEIRRKKSAVLCEGYFDCIGLHQAGVKNAVALCSTALTPGHLALLQRLEAKELVLLLDGDKAGRDAVHRLAGVLLATGSNARVALLPEGEDPDTYALKAGATAVQELVQRAMPLTQHLFESLLPSGQAASYEQKIAALDSLRPVTAQIPPGLSRTAFFGAMGRHFGWPTSELDAALRAKPSVPSRPAVAASTEPPPDMHEASYAAFLMQDKNTLALDTHRAFDELRHIGIRALVGAIQSGQGAIDVLYESSQVLKSALQKARDALPPEQTAREQAFRDVCRTLKLRSIDERLRRIGHLQANAPGGSTDLTDEARDLLEERAALLALKRALLAPK